MRTLRLGFVVLCLVFPARWASAQDFHGCALDGDGGDPALNNLKNRTEMPDSFTTEHLDDLITSLPEPAGIARHKRATWPADALSAVGTEEKRAVQITGFLLAAKHEGPESCNCHSDEFRDYHVWVGNTADEDRSGAMVVEIAPRVGSTHPSWGTKIVGLAKTRAKVRISGWLMLDQEHPEQIGKTRATLWEIHPVMNIETFTGGKWKPL
jgi:hypothetical protein